jgi:hypothetical protein
MATTTAPSGPLAPGSIVDVQAWWTRKTVRCKVAYALSGNQVAVTPTDGSYTRIVNIGDVQVIKAAAPATDPAPALESEPAPEAPT